MIRAIPTKQYIQETYFIESYKELAISPEINWSTKAISWLNTNLNSKKFSFSECLLEDKEIVVKGQTGQELRFKLLTLAIFNQYIRVNNVPAMALESDQNLREWFSQVFVNQA